MAGFEELLTTAWLGPILWAALYVSDYTLRVACARLYRAQDHIVFEGSYEITPMFQADIDGLRKDGASPSAATSTVTALRDRE